MSTFPPPPPGQGPIDPRGAMGLPVPPAPQPGYPPTFTPPPMYFPPPPRTGGFARAILITLATTLFGLSLTLNIYFLIYIGLTGREVAGRVETKVLRDGDATRVIAVVPLTGLLDRNTFERFDKCLARVEADKNVKALVIDIDSPGGEVTASDQIYQRIRRFRQERKVPVVASMRSLAASGGYYVACAAEHIVAQPTTITGSIGVRLDRLSLAGLGEKYGIEDNSLASTGADYKNVGSLWTRDTPEQKAYLQALIDDSFEQFKRVVADGRKLSSEAVNVAANGKAYTSNQALPLKLIDQIGYAHDGFDRAAALANVTNARVVEYKATPSFWDVLAGESAARAGGHRLDRSTLHELAAPKLMYLWSGQ